jgi:ABC-type Fe3+/spermidine/putrescine transport system ATPase subunit
MRAELDRLQRQLAIPMLLITHDREDVEALRPFAAHGAGRLIDTAQTVQGVVHEG